MYIYIYAQTDTCCMTRHVLGSVCTSCFTPSYGLQPLELDWACDSKNLSGLLTSLVCWTPGFHSGRVFPRSHRKYGAADWYEGDGKSEHGEVEPVIRLTSRKSRHQDTWPKEWHGPALLVWLEEDEEPVPAPPSLKRWLDAGTEMMDTSHLRHILQRRMVDGVNTGVHETESEEGQAWIWSVCATLRATRSEAWRLAHAQHLAEAPWAMVDTVGVHVSLPKGVCPKKTRILRICQRWQHAPRLVSFFHGTTAFKAT